MNTYDSPDETSSDVSLSATNSVQNVVNEGVDAIKPAVPSEISQEQFSPTFYNQILQYWIGVVYGRLTGDRSCIVVVINNTNSPLRLGTANHLHGGYASTSRPQYIIPPQSSDGFGVVSTSPFTGVEGYLPYYDQYGNVLTVHWNNPRIGSNSCDATLQGPSTWLYRPPFYDCSTGDTGAWMRFILEQKS